MVLDHFLRRKLDVCRDVDYTMRHQGQGGNPGEDHGGRAGRGNFEELEKEKRREVKGGNEGRGERNSTTWERIMAGCALSRTTLALPTWEFARSTRSTTGANSALVSPMHRYIKGQL
jgi:hypothetical protein